MERRNPWRSRLLVSGGLALGFLAGCWVKSRSQAELHFLGAAGPIAEVEEKMNGSVQVVSYYTVDRDCNQIFSQAKKELPNAFARDEFLGGIRARILTVPRVEHGRVQIGYPPLREITFLPRHLAVNRVGVVVALAEASHPWTGIQMRDFRSPRPLDGLVEWFRKNWKS